MKTYSRLFAGLLLLAVAAQVRADDTEEKIQKYFELATAGKDEAETKKVGDSVLTAAKDDANVLNDFAWKILTDEGIAKRDLDLAMRTAKAAFDKNLFCGLAMTPPSRPVLSNICSPTAVAT